MLQISLRDDLLMKRKTNYKQNRAVFAEFSGNSYRVEAEKEIKNPSSKFGGMMNFIKKTFSGKRESKSKFMKPVQEEVL